MLIQSIVISRDVVLLLLYFTHTHTIIVRSDSIFGRLNYSLRLKLSIYFDIIDGFSATNKIPTTAFTENTNTWTHREDEEVLKSTVNSFATCLLEPHTFASYSFQHVTCVWLIYPLTKITSGKKKQHTDESSPCSKKGTWQMRYVRAEREREKKKCARTHQIDFSMIALYSLKINTVFFFHVILRLMSSLLHSDNITI